MIYINHSFYNGFFHRVLTEVPHHACALNIPICPTSTTMGSPGSFPGTLHCFRQFPGTPGEANESDPVSPANKAIECATIGGMRICPLNGYWSFEYKS